MENMNMNVNGFYGANLGEYGVGSMMALMTEQEQPGTIPLCGPSLSSYDYGHMEALLSAGSMLHGSASCLPPIHNHNDKHLVDCHFDPQQLMRMDQTAVLSNRMEFHGKASEGLVRCGLEQEISPRVSGLEVDSACSSSLNETIDALKIKIVGHPHYPRLMAAYMEFHKIGAPPEVVAVLDDISKDNHYGNHLTTMNIGVDPELDQFMEAYCEMLGTYHQQLTKTFKEAMAFVDKIETQLNCSSAGGVITNSPPDSMEEREEGGASSEDEFCYGEFDLQELDPCAEDKELKDQLLRKYGGYFSSLKQEFLKKKKKGKLPKEARQKLLEWWDLHYKWPYPSEGDKVALAESTGLDQKQINNWFINQRKRHWKPSEDMQFMVMESLNSHNVSDVIEG